MHHRSSELAGGGRPLVFAHRGSTDIRPEHTLEAYLHAIAEGVDGLECDVRLTRDGHLVCIHDRRLDRTSNGRGPVSTATLAELAELDFGSWHASEEAAEAEILTLDVLLEAVLAAGRPLRVLIETKHPTRHGASVELALVAMLERYGLADPGPRAPVHVTVMSFSALAIRRIRTMTPAVPTVYLVEFLPPWVRTARLPYGARILGPGVHALRTHPELVQYAHARGHPVYVWTVNTADQLAMALDLGVDGIITDRPAYVLATVNPS